jgi:hypothetical protein
MREPLKKSIGFNQAITLSFAIHVVNRSPNSLRQQDLIRQLFAFRQ